MKTNFLKENPCAALWRQMSLLLLVLVTMAVVQPARAAEPAIVTDWSVSPMGPGGRPLVHVTWQVTTPDVGIARFTILGGGRPLLEQIPSDGWTFTGNARMGLYQWERDENATGTFTFSITFAGNERSANALRAEYALKTVAGQTLGLPFPGTIPPQIVGPGDPPFDSPAKAPGLTNPPGSPFPLLGTGLVVLGAGSVPFLIGIVRRRRRIRRAID